MTPYGDLLVAARAWRDDDPDEATRAELDGSWPPSRRVTARPAPTSRTVSRECSSSGPPGCEGRSAPAPTG